MKENRNRAISESLIQIRSILDQGVTAPRLESAEAVLMHLCEKKELFPRTDFPVPRGGDETQLTFLLHQDVDGGYSLYINSDLPGQVYRPHDHGGSWAIVAAIEGREKHRLYVADSNGHAGIRLVTEIVVEPGHAVSILPEGIHSVESLGEEPLLHLHLYGKGFHQQSARIEYDLETGRVEHFNPVEDFKIRDAR